MPKAEWKGTVIAESPDCIMLENNWYFPPESLNKEFFHESSTTTVCSWKGTANYFDIKVGSELNKDAAWVYRKPKSAAAEITNYVAFWKGVRVSS
jgi:uncharacterized protein (DUF427 family)